MLHASRYFGFPTHPKLPSHAPLSNRRRLVLECGLRTGTVRSLAVRFFSSSHLASLSLSQKWRVDASMPSVAD